MHASSIVLPLALVAPLQCMFAQGRAFSDARLPADSIELKPHDPPATSTPWQLPKPGDPLYDPEKEAQIKKENEAKAKGNSHLVHLFERGVFKGYDTLGWNRSPEPPAKKMGSVFKRNFDLPPDAVELSASEQPDKSDYFPTRPNTRPPNVLPDYIAVRVFHRGKLIGWTFMSKEAVALLHKNRTRPNQSMKPTTPFRNAFSVIATTPWISSKCPATLVRFASSRSRTPAVMLFNASRGL